LNDLLRDRRDSIVAGWFDLVAKSYPPETEAFLKRENDPFGNPVGAAARQGLREVFDELTGANDSGRILAALDRIIRIRSVQDFSPSEAVAFAYRLKGIVRDEFRDAAGEELREFEARMDAMALLAFETYTKCREELHEVRARDIRRRSHLLVERLSPSEECDGCSGGSCR